MTKHEAKTDLEHSIIDIQKRARMENRISRKQLPKRICSWSSGCLQRDF